MAHGAFRDERRFRPEIHGVRGIAIAGVVLFHIMGSGRVSGGIDAFLAITGFLAFPSLLRRAEVDRGLINLAARWAGVTKRILIPIVPLLIFVGLVANLIYPISQMAEIWDQELASLLGYENWALVAQMRDYNAPGADVSPLQHLWSVSVQLQFHLVAPFVVMLVTLPLIVWKKNPRVPLVIFLFLISIGSLVYAVHLHEVNQGVNYFSTFSRAWELCLPGAVALLIPYLKLGSNLRSVISWLGLVMLFLTGFIFDGASLFPSFEALWPVTGLLLVLVAGETRSKFGTDRLWQFPPIIFLANIAYSLYLWHWPILIFWYAWTDKNSLSVLEMITIIAVSIVTAWLSCRIFEKWLPNASYFTQIPLVNWRTLATICVVLGLGAVVFPVFSGDATAKFEAELEAQAARAAQRAAKRAEEARIQAEAEVKRQEEQFVPVHELVPSPEIARSDASSVFEIENSSCYELGRDIRGIEFCQTLAGATSTVLFAGGSHVNQWWGAIEDWATENDVNLAMTGRGGCLLMDIDSDPERFQSIVEDDPTSDDALCVQWNERALPAIIQFAPDVVVTLATRVRDEETVEPASVAAWQLLTDAGIQVITIRDTPYWTLATDRENDAVACVINNPKDTRVCNIPRTYNPSFDNALPGSMPPAVTYLDVAPLVCPPGPTCPAAVDGYLIYRDGNHLTNTFVETFSPRFTEVVQSALDAH